MAHPLRIDLIARPVGALCRGDGIAIAEHAYVAEGALSLLVGRCFLQRWMFRCFGNVPRSVP